MRRALQLFVLFLTAVALAAVIFAPACSNECKRVDDCMHGEVCYKGICTQNSAEYVRCDTDDDCSTSGRFVCRAGRCTFKSTVVIPPDSGVHPDAMGMDAMALPDAMSTDTGTVGADR